jgi:signal peptide peptidase SppA
MPLNNAQAALLGAYGSVWAIESGEAQRYLSIMEHVDIGAHMREYQAARASGSGKPSREGNFERVGNMAVFTIDGPMTRQANSMQSIIGGTSTMEVRAQVRAADKDADIEAGIVYITSGGGDVNGTDDLGKAFADFAQSKPLIAFVSSVGASAAYWVASQCSEIVCTPTAWVGSIGVVTSVRDSSRAAVNAGVDIDEITSGKFKGGITPGAKVSDNLKSKQQDIVDKLAGMFVSAVATGRGMDNDAVAALADGRMFTAEEALANGLIDRIAHEDDVIALIQSGAILSKSAKADIANKEKETMASPIAAFKEWLAGVPDDAVATTVTAPAQAAAATAPTPEAIALQAALAAEQAKVASLQATVVRKDAEAFANGEIAGARAHAVEREGLIASYMQAYADDSNHGGASRVEALVARQAKRPSHALLGEMPNGAAGATVVIPDAGATGGTRENPQAASDKPMSAERRAELLAMTPEGKIILKEGK